MSLRTQIKCLPLTSRVQGWPNHRVRGKAYDEFIDKFVQLVRKYHPHSLLHFEDFGVGNAKRLLDVYRDQHSVFNDDMYEPRANHRCCYY